MTTLTQQRKPSTGYAVTIILAACAILLVAGIIAYPEQAFQASLQGLSLWWDIVFPAMLPFLILSEMMIAFGVMHFLGIWLEPVMRKGLRLPGQGSWALSMAMTSGYPAGARTTALMREKLWITREEGERLLAYSYLCSPIFVISVVAVGFFHNASLGWLLLGLHFASWLFAVLIFRFLLWSSPPTEGAEAPLAQDSMERSRPMRRAIQAMLIARNEDGRSFGKLMGDAVTQSIQTMLMIGGYMMLFSVIMAISHSSGVIPLLTHLLQSLCYTIGIPANVIQPLLTGMMEIHLGTHASSGSNIPPAWQAAGAGAVMAWGGWSVHAQVKSLAARTDLSLVPYLQFRLLHSLAAFLLTLLLWKPLLVWFSPAQPSTGTGHPVPPPSHELPNLWLSWPDALLWGGIALLVLACGSIIARLLPSRSA